MNNMCKHYRKWRDNPKAITALWIILSLGLFPGTEGKDCLYGRNPGQKYSTNFNSEDYNLQPQNWEILQDHRGVIYAANNGGILEYDGVSWDYIEIPNQTARSIAIDDTGTIYVGGINDIGYLAPAPSGRLEYISLLKHIDEDKEDFGYVYGTHAAGDNIFFRTSKYLFRWNSRQKKMKVPLESKKGEDDRFNSSHTSEGKYFINQYQVGLWHLEKGSFRLIPGSETFAKVTKVFMITPYDKSGQKLLIGTRDKGFFIYQNQTLEPLDREVNQYLKEKRASHGLRLCKSPGDIAVATLKGGLIIIDDQGKLKHLLTKDFGLQEKNVKHVLEDAQGNLWLSLENGIAKIEYLSPLSVYDQHSGLPGLVLSVSRHSNGLYAGTSEGLYYLSPNSSKFTLIGRIEDKCFSLLSIADSLLAATDKGVFQLKNSDIRQISDTPAYALIQSRENPNRVWVGMRNTLASLKSAKDNWFEESRYKKVDRQIRTIVEDQVGNLWLGARGAGVSKLEFKGNNSTRDYNVKVFNDSNRLPNGEIQVCWAAGHVMFGSNSGLHRFDANQNLFIPDTTLGQEPGIKLDDIYRIVEDINGTIWFHVHGRNYAAYPKPGQSHEITWKPLARIPISAQVNAIYPDPLENALWFATHKGLIRYEPGIKKDYRRPYHTIIRKVLINGVPQFYNPGSPSINNNQEIFTEFDYDKRNIRFEFAAPFFESEERTVYYHILEGYDHKWSEYKKSVYKSYTNLDVGIYTFRVRARNIYQQNSKEAAFKFRILPPWYRTWWAFLLYFLLAVLVIILTSRWRAKEKKQRRLEQEIRDRAVEIDQKNQQLEKQTRQLMEQAEQLKELDQVKSRFFTNVSHELRTPLTLILGPLEQLLERGIPEKVKEKLCMMHQNSHRLLTRINQLLDLSRIESGKMKLKVSNLDIISFLKRIFDSFQEALLEKELNLDFQPGQNSIFLYFDVEKIEDVISNLLSNAIKFSPTGGIITFSAAQDTNPNEDFPQGTLKISVRDQGIGIPKEQLPHIFDRFYQVDSKKQKHKGTGIGLALTREWVLLHHGKINVHSRQGEDSLTEFIIRLPLGQTHLEPGEIVPLHKKEPVSESEAAKEFHTANQCEEKPVDIEDWEDLTEIEEVTDVSVESKEKQTPPKTVLVVEDEPDMRKFIRQSIQDNYIVVEADDGKKGMEKAREITPDLVISDIMMPEIDGYELCRELKTGIETSHVPVILLTAKASEHSVIEGWETGADDYITKPFNTKILLTRIKNLIDLRRQLQEKFQRQMVLQPSEIKVSSLDQRFIEKLQKIIKTNLSDPELNVESLSEKMDISRVTLNKKIVALTGETANQFIRSCRLKRAMELLKKNFGSVTDVAYEVGFSSSSYFTKCFGEKFHQLPSAFLGEGS